MDLYKIPREVFFGIVDNLNGKEIASFRITSKTSIKLVKEFCKKKLQMILDEIEPEKLIIPFLVN